MRSLTRFRLLAVVTSIAALSVLPTSVAGGNNIPILTEDEAITKDAHYYAAEYDVSHEEAIRRLTLQPVAGDVISRAAEELGDRFAGGWIEHIPTYGVVIGVTGLDSQNVGTDSLLSAEVPVRLEAATHSTRQLETALERAQKVLGNRGTKAALEIDVRSGHLRVRTQARLTSAVSRDVQLAAGDVAVDEEIGGPDELSDVYGGKRLTQQGSTTIQCTSTFTVRNVVTGVTGLLTAGHCSNSMHYWHNGTIHFDITYQYERWDADQDWQWHTTPDTEVGVFWDGGSYRAVTGTEPRSSMVGDFACHYGFVTGQSCGTIQSITYVPNLPFGCGGVTCAAVYARVTGSGLKSSGGDSGGPWFVGGRAYGIHMGSAGTTPNLSAFFNTINYISGSNNNLTLILG